MIHILLRPRLAALRPRHPDLLPARTRPKQTALGQAVLALARRHILTLHAMIRNGTLYDPDSSTRLPAAAWHTAQRHPLTISSWPQRSSSFYIHYSAL